MRINCICCGHRFDLGDAYDDYDGPVRCATCRNLIDIRTAGGAVRSMRPFVAFAQPAPAPAPAPAPVQLRAPVYGGPEPIAAQPAASAPATPAPVAMTSQTPQADVSPLAFPAATPPASTSLPPRAAA